MKTFQTVPFDDVGFQEHLKDRAKRQRYWGMLKTVRTDEYYEDYKGVFDLTSRPTFHYYMEQKYGIKMGIDSHGDYTSEYTVSDPKKFMLLQIKYGL